MSYYIRGRCEDGIVYALCDLDDKIHSWVDKVEDATWFGDIHRASAVLNKRSREQQYPSWVWNVQIRMVP